MIVKHIIYCVCSTISVMHLVRHYKTLYWSTSYYTKLHIHSYHPKTLQHGLKLTKRIWKYASTMPSLVYISVKQKRLQIGAHCCPFSSRIIIHTYIQIHTHRYVHTGKVIYNASILDNKQLLKHEWYQSHKMLSTTRTAFLADILLNYPAIFHSWKGFWMSSTITKLTNIWKSKFPYTGR